jgi:aryl-alcohol dehydrogenase-like predicted oxidoreductase
MTALDELEPLDEVVRCLTEATQQASAAALRARAGLSPANQAQEALAAARAAVIAARYAVWCSQVENDRPPLRPLPSP